VLSNIVFRSVQIPCPDLTGQGNQNADHEKTDLENIITSFMLLSELGWHFNCSTQDYLEPDAYAVLWLNCAQFIHK